MQICGYLCSSQFSPLIICARLMIMCLLYSSGIPCCTLPQALAKGPLAPNQFSAWKGLLLAPSQGELNLDCLNPPIKLGCSRQHQYLWALFPLWQFFILILIVKSEFPGKIVHLKSGINNSVQALFRKQALIIIFFFLVFVLKLQRN